MWYVSIFETAVRTITDVVYGNMPRLRLAVCPRRPSRYGHVAAGTHDGLLIVYGGYTGSTYLQDLWAIRVLDYAVANNGHGRSC